MTLTEFLAARLDEDEAAAKAAQLRFPSPWSQAEAPGSPLPSAVSLYDARDESVAVIRGSYAAAHIARHDPARVLREVEAKRKILDQCVHSLSYKRPVPAGKRGEWALASLVAEALALPYAGHPDYDEAVRALT